MKNKKYLIIGIIATLIIAAIACAITILALQNSNKTDSSEDEDFYYEGTIDCMPPLSDKEAELCQKAKAAGYPNIVY